MNCSRKVADIVAGDIVSSIVDAMKLVDEMDCSQNHFMHILQFGKQLYERGLKLHSAESSEVEDMESLWPKSWQNALKLLNEAGYIPPKTYYVCLNASHYCTWDVMAREEDTCRHCGEPGSIKYYYLSLYDKV